jgi:SAM-dependent methyltransferase
MSSLILRYLKYLQQGAAHDSWKQIRSVIVSNPQSVLLDCGCSDGEGTLQFAQWLKPSEIYGIDLDSGNAATASRAGVMTCLADLNKHFPFQDNFADVVFVNQVIEHLTDLDNFVQEVHRVLKPGGYAVVCTENLSSWNNIFALLIGDQPFTGPHVSSKFLLGPHPFQKSMDSIADKIGHNKVLAYKPFKQLFTLYGFEVLIKGSGYYPWPIFLANVLQRIDKRHSAYLTVRARKGS